MDCDSSTDICGVLLRLHLGGSEEVGFSIWIGECGSGVNGRIFGEVRVMVFPSRFVVLLQHDFRFGSLRVMIHGHRFALGTEHREH